MRKSQILLLFLLSFFACSPSLKPTMPAPKLTFAGVKIEKDATVSNSMVYVDDFIDNRALKAIATQNGKEVNSENDLAPVVMEGLKHALSEKGFSFSDSAPVIISGELREWTASISGKLPTKVEANSALFVEILDPANKRIYSGVYKGFSSMQAASVNENDVRNTLASAMEEAIKQVSADKQLLTLLSSY